MSSIALDLTPPPLRLTKPRWPRLARAAPAALSLLIHGALFIYFGAAILDKGSLQTRHGPISVHLVPAPAPITAEPRKALAVKPLTPVHPTQTKPVRPKPIASVKKRTVTPPVKIPVEIAAALTEPTTELAAERPTETSTEIPAERPTETRTEVLAERTIETPAEMPTATARTQQLPTEEQRQQAKQHYLVVLMAHIESNKHYPRAARQRRMEGAVTVRFTLLASGEVSEINISGGPKLLRIASKAALQKALPLPPPPDTIDYPLPIQFNMEYRLI